MFTQFVSSILACEQALTQLAGVAGREEWGQIAQESLIAG